MSARRECVTVWICVDCTMLHANGEVDPDLPDDEPAPLSLIGEGESLTLGLLAEEHGCGWTGEMRDRPECDCEVRGFDTSRCDGCGSWMHGERYGAAIWWTPKTEES